ncbi:hypothetical protein J2S05_001435 [Alkalicoccobacillus murimartini]|uniref:Uncharacterized protein n=1 Tax=Alkalicoccobacillus murimartini TaxID=171685 RepID=A0ABT9YG22_9BACI|nr:hypothetical protein [Alkalicoccobacillus murimartini]
MTEASKYVHDESGAIGRPTPSQDEMDLDMKLLEDILSKLK